MFTPHAAVNCPACRFDVTHTRPIGKIGVESAAVRPRRSQHRANRHERILLDVAIFQHDVDHRIAIRAHEAIAVVVERQTELPDAGNGLECSRAADRTENPCR